MKPTMPDFSVFSEDYIGFLGKSFATLSPNEHFLMNWHLDLLSEYLAAIERHEIRRLIINMPPRSLKSIAISVAWPAWLLGQQPEQKIIAASYSQALANKHSLDCRTILQSGWYQQLFPTTQLSREQNEKHKYITTRGGMRLATSIWGSMTGEGADVLIADDPMNPIQARSPLTRRHVRDWFEHTFCTRLNDKRHGAIVIVMQRLHQEDVCGHLLAKGGWEHLCLPAIAERDRSWHIGGRRFHYAQGAFLHTQREDEALLMQAKRELGSANFNAQYLQSPQAESGGMLRLEWFARY